MFYKNKITLLLSVVIIFSLAGCAVKEEAIKKKPIIKKKVYKRENISINLLKSIKEIKLLVSRHNFNILNKRYINKKFGYYDKYKFQNNIVFEHKNKLNFKKEDKDYFSIENSISRASKNIHKLKLYRYNPKFNCSPNSDEFYGWNKQGSLLSSILNRPLLSKSESINKDLKEKYEHSLLIDKTSYKLVLSEDEIVLYLSKIDKNWYITLFDRVQTDCSTYKKKRKKKIRKKK